MFASVAFYKRHQPPPNSLVMNPVGDPLLCSHIDFSWISTDFIPGGRVEKVCRNYGASPSDICVHTCTSSRENREEVQIMSESSSCVNTAWSPPPSSRRETHNCSSITVSYQWFLVLFIISIISHLCLADVLALWLQLVFLCSSLPQMKASHPELFGQGCIHPRCRNCLELMWINATRTEC